ncbi:MAG: DUF6514 family protein [Bacillota bacterium]|nr:DUF6514 family protein [Bacillota bacterium]
MLKKYLQQKIDIDSNENCEVTKGKIELEYYILESESSQWDLNLGDKVYGIEIIKKTEEKNIESEFVRNLSNHMDNVKSILDKMVKNSVTPVGLPFVLDDLIGV